MIKIIEIFQINRQKYKIKFSDGTEFIAPLRYIRKYSLKSGQEFNTEEFEKLVYNIQCDIAEYVTLKKLNSKKRTEKELVKELHKYFISNNVINSIIEKYKSYNYINDNDYIQSYIRDNVNLKLKSFRQTNFELKKKGFAQHIIEQSFSDLVADNQINEYKTLSKIINKKKHRYKNYKTDFEQKNKFIKYLLSKGFNYDTIKQLI